MTIGKTSRLTGVESWRLRAWERAGLLTPDRTASGYRLYSTADIERVRELQAHQDPGRRFGLYGAADFAADQTSPAPDDASSGTALLPVTAPDSAGVASTAWRDAVDVERRISKRIAQTVAHAEDLSTVYLELLDCAMEVAGATAGAISFVNPARQQYFLVAHRGLSDRYVRGISEWKLHEGLAGKVYGMREPLVVDDLSHHAAITREIVRLERLRAYACLPLVRGPSCYGVIEVMSRDGRTFDRKDVAALSGIVATLSVVAESAMLGAELLALRDERQRVFRDWADQAMAASETERNQILQGLRDEIETLGSDISQGLGATDVLTRSRARLTEMADALIGADRSWVDLVPALRDHLVPKVRQTSGKDVRFEAGAVSTQLPLSATSRLYVALSNVLSEAARAARERVEVVVFTDTRGLVIEVADDREGPVGLDAAAGMSDETEHLVRSTGVKVEQGMRVDYSSVLVLVLPLEPFQSPDINLTDREWDILRGLSSGLSNRELAKQFSISQKTVQNHLTTIYRKIGVGSRGQAIRFVLSSESPGEPVRDFGTGPMPRA